MSVLVRYGYVIQTAGRMKEVLALGSEPFDVVCLVSLPDPLFGVDVFDQTTVIGFEPSSDLREVMEYATQLENIVFHSPLLKVFEVEATPRFVAGYAWLQEDEDDEDEEDDEDSEEEDSEEEDEDSEEEDEDSEEEDEDSEYEYEEDEDEDEEDEEDADEESADEENDKTTITYRYDT